MVQGLSFAQVEVLLGLDEIGLLELVVAGSIHLVSSESGDSRICGRSLEGAVET